MILPSHFQLGDAIYMSGLPGRVVGVRFTRTAVLYDVALQSGEKTRNLRDIAEAVVRPLQESA